MLKFKVSTVRGVVAEFADQADAIAFAKVKSRDDRNVTYWESLLWAVEYIAADSELPIFMPKLRAALAKVQP